jgi:hypothetical protein
LAAAELVAARAKAKAAAAADAARAAAVEVEVLCGSVSSSISADCSADAGLDVLVREAARERVVRWAAALTLTNVVAAQTGAVALTAPLEEVRTAVALLEERMTTVADGLMESAAFIGGMTLSQDRNRGYHRFQAVVRDVGPGGGWPTLTKTDEGVRL